MKSLFIILFLTLFAQFGTAQTPDTFPGQTAKSAAEMLQLLNTQVGISDARYFAEIMGTVPGVGSNAEQLLTAQSVKSYMMPPREATGKRDMESYALAACLEFYTNYRQNYKVNLSPDYINLSLRNGAQAEQLGNAFKFLMENGTVSAAILPYGATAISSAVYATQKYQIKNYLHLFRTDSKPRQKVFETRRALMRGHPVLLQMKVDDNFLILKNTRYWTPASTTENANQRETVIAVGYDEDLEAFELLTFRGTGWGNNGYIYVDYEDFGKYVADGFVLVYRE